ncbi:MAG: squalene synthase HpnC [Rhodoferax sp.]|nr:MAG: squalene synthase HpnC [Rhodoferax sp.]
MPQPPHPQAPVQPNPVTHYENFPVASWLCPPPLRAPIAAIYHFARTADDLADEGESTAEQRLNELHRYRQALQAVAQAQPPYPANAPWHTVFAPLQSAIAQHRLPLPLLDDLLRAFVQDVERTASGQRYRDEAELLDYCRLSANPVGRLLLHLYGVQSEQALAWSDDICSALQLINFWQDLSTDIPRQRYYLPLDLCARFGVTETDMLACKQTSSATLLIATLADSARARMQKGAQLVHLLPGRAGWELRLVVQGGLRILDKMAALQYRTLHQRPVLRGWDYGVMLWRALWM